jgi:hypothetical protein
LIRQPSRNVDSARIAGITSTASLTVSSSIPIIGC